MYLSMVDVVGVYLFLKFFLVPTVIGKGAAGIFVKIYASFLKFFHDILSRSTI